MSDREATAMVLDAPRQLVARAVQLPEIGEDDGLLRIEACGLCGTDHEQFAGAGFVMVTGHGERDHQRLEWATKLGADLFVDVEMTDPKAAFRAASGTSGADIVVDVTARAPAALAQAVSLARSGGTIVLAGTRGSAETVGFDPDSVVLKELRLLGAFGVDTNSYRAALDLLASGRFPFAELPRTIVGFDGIGSLLSTMAGFTDSTPPIHGVFVPTRTGTAMP